MIENIFYKRILIAIIIYHNYKEKGINFFTPSDFSQQLAYMRHPKGKEISPHVHNAVERKVHFTKEVLFIKKGKLRVDFFSDKQKYLESKVLTTGDVVLLSGGGHGFEAIEEVEMIEVKQGPYAGEADKTRFDKKIKKLIINN